MRAEARRGPRLLKTRRGRASPLRARLRVTSFLLLFAGPAAAQEVPLVGTIDFYGLRSLPVRRVQQALGVRTGLRLDYTAAMELEERLLGLPGVSAAKVSIVCCEDGKSTLYVGIQERDAAVLDFYATPNRNLRLSQDVIDAGAAFERAFMAAVARGDAGEDVSQGHSLMNDSASRAIQRRFVTYAARDSAQLRDVLRNAFDFRQRVLAAQVLGYAPDKKAVVADLARAIRDPDDDVRNSAMRSLVVIAKYAQARGETGIVVPYRGFVDLLNSLIWSDLNKASWALHELTASRDSTMLATIRQVALRPLADIARWKSDGHAKPGFFLLGRLAGWPEQEIQAAWDRRENDRVIDAAGASRE